MEEEIQLILEETEDLMKKAISHFEMELTKIRAGKANPTMLDSVKVEYYQNLTPLAQIANISALDSKTLSVRPWEKNMLEKIEKAIINSNIGLNPQNNGESILISIPPLTEERRKELVKKAKNEAENAKISIRNARREANDYIKKLKNEGLAEDIVKKTEKQIQNLTDKYIKIIDKLTEAKENDILTV